MVAIPFGPTVAAADTVEKRVATSADDAEQAASGSMYLNSSDLELVVDTSNQTVGMRWTNLLIPPGSTVTAAYIQFTAKEAQTESTNVTIQGQAADNAATFAATANNISTRLRTTAATTWIPAAWTVGAAGAAQRTPDLTNVIQEVVGRPGWAYGNALAIVITGIGHRTAYAFDVTATQCPLLHVEFTPGANPTAMLSVSQLPTPALTVRADGSASRAGSGGAIASYTFNFGDGTAPVTTTAPTATAQHTYAAPGPYTVTLTVTDVGSNVSPPATTSFTVLQNNPPVARLTLSQLATPALTVRADGSTSTDTDFAPIASYQFAFGDGTPPVTTTVPTAIAQHTYALAGTYTVTLTATDAGGLTSLPVTANLNVQVDSPPVARLTVTQISSPALTVVADGTTSTDTDITPIASYRFTFGDGTAAVTTTAPTSTTQHTYAAAGTYTVTLVATDTGALASAPVTASIVVNPPVSGATTLEKRVAVSADDAEEFANGTTYTNSTDLELVFGDGNIQKVGMRWTALAIPFGAQITAAYVQFDADELQSEVTALTIAGQAADSAAIFATTSGNVSTRPRTTATVAWSPNPWTAGQVGFDQRTPDLRPVFQEIVNRPGWKSGNALALIVTGTGHRTAVAYDGGATKAPLLHVEYLDSGAPSARLAVSSLASPPYTEMADGSASTAPNGKTIVSYRFDFGDGTAAVTTTSPTASSQHTYAAAGTYTASLIVTDSGGRISAPATASVTFVPEAPPTARLSLSQLASPALTVRADGSASTDPDPTPIATYRFDFGDGSAPVTTNAPTSTAQHAYVTAGTYTVTLIATDTGGFASAPATASITVQAEQIPVARLTVSQVVPTPALTVRADGSTSTDPDHTPIASYRFDFGDGTAAVTTTAPTAIAQHTYAAAGTYIVSLVATDTGGNPSAAVTASITVIREDPPTARLSLTQLVTPALTVRADGSASTDADLTPIASYRFTFGDGTAAVTTTAPTTVAQHTYAAAGTYTVTLIATDTGGNASTAASASIVVVPENPPTARLTVTQLGSPALTVSADASTSTDTDMTPIASCRFDFGDGTSPVTTTWPTATAQHTYAVSGNFIVTLRVTDTGGYVSAPVTVTLPVLGRTTAERRVAAATDDAEQRANGSVTLTSSSLQLVLDSSNQQTVGLRWTGVPIAKGTPISAAYIQFTASTSQTGTMALTIAGQAADNAATFTTSTNNVSSRSRTAATVAWAPGSWTSGQAGAAQRTPDLTAMIQEIVNRSGWVAGNALAVVITGTGSRTAWSYDGNTAAAPLLHVEYLGIGTGPTARLTVAQIASPPLTARADGSTSTPGDSPIATYRFDFGDGTAAVTTTAPTSTAQHAYAAAGTYTVTLNATDTGGRSSAPVSASVTVAVSTSGPIAVYTGYYSTHHPDNIKPKPSPWYGSSGVVFAGTPDSPSGGWDTSAIRIDNLSTGPVTVTVTADVGSSHFALWGSRTIPFEQTLILAQTGFENFDGSDLNPAGCYDCNPNDCLTKVQSTIPVVHVTMGSTTTNYYDTGQVINTNGVDAAGCPYTGGRNDESHVWQQIFNQAPAALVTSEEAARGELEAAPVRTRRLWLGPPSPNPAGAELVLRYEMPTRDDVHLGIYDISGRLIKSHMDGMLDAGEYVSHINLADVPAGMYYFTMRTGGRTLHQRFVHVR
jgi:PKD repeat protein